MKIIVMEVSPEQAAVWLDGNVDNRKVRKHMVQAYAEAMRRGEWMVTHQPIALTRSGRLLDGQHRLLAIIEADMTIRMAVCLDADPATYKVVDQGAMRSHADVFRISRTIIEPVRILANVHLHAWGRITPTEMTRYLTVFGNDVAALEGVCNARRAGVSQASVRAAAVLQARRYGQSTIFPMYRALVLLRFDEMWPSVQALYRQLVAGSHGDGSRKQSSIFVRAMRAFDPTKQGVTRIQINDAASGITEARDMIDRLMGGSRS